jgi:hypothetical protein
MRHAARNTRCMTSRLATTIGTLTLPNPVICGSGEPVMTAAGIRSALRAGAAGVIAKSVNEQPAAARQLDRADYAQLDAGGAPVQHGVSIFCRSGLAQYDPASWFATLARIDRDAARDGRFVWTRCRAMASKRMCRIGGGRSCRWTRWTPELVRVTPSHPSSALARERGSFSGLLQFV